jgi:hypothetical protein
MPIPPNASIAMAVIPSNPTSRSSRTAGASRLTPDQRFTADHGVGKVELAVEFERACLNCQGPRGGATFCRLVDDAYLGSERRPPPLARFRLACRKAGLSHLTVIPSGRCLTAAGMLWSKVRASDSRCGRLCK